jgi:hypothetical protein
MADEKPITDLRKLKGPLLQEELVRLLAMEQMPVDIKRLIAAGAIAKRGKRLKLLDWRKLPPHAQRKVCEMTWEKSGTYLKFRNARGGLK